MIALSDDLVGRVGAALDNLANSNEFARHVATQLIGEDVRALAKQWEREVSDAEQGVMPLLEASA